MLAHSIDQTLAKPHRPLTGGEVFVSNQDPKGPFGYFKTFFH
jgi:hypothetical protein